METKVTRITPQTTVMAQTVQEYVAAYARVSGGKDAQLHSLSAQISHYSALIQRTPGWVYAGVYTDEALTGTRDTRPEFQRLLADCRAGKITRILTKSVSRFARNAVTTLETVRELRELDVVVCFEEQGIDSSGVDGEFLLTLLAAYVQEESVSVSENLKWRIREKYKRGEPGSITMYGYRLVNGVLEVVPEEAEVTRLAARYYLQGFGGQRTAKLLNDMGIPTKQGKQWRDHIVREMLFNEKVAGDMLLQKKYVIDPITKQERVNRGELPQYHVANSHEGILGKETYAAILAERERRAAHFRPPREKKAIYPFSGKIVCGHCGVHFRRKVAGAAPQYKKPVWICQTFNTQGKAHCPSRQIPEDILQRVTAQAMGLRDFDAKAFEQGIKEIRVPENGALIFVFRDGREITRTWENPSRRESWDEAARQRAREHAKKRYEGGLGE